MARFLKKTTKKTGLPPGTLVFVGEQKMETTLICLIDYNPVELIEKQLSDIMDVEQYIGTSNVTWVNIYGVHDTTIVKNAGKVFDLSSLLLEDVMHTDQRPKIVEFDNCIFIVVKMLRFDDASEKILSEQLSIIVGDKFLLTFQEQEGDIFESVRSRIRKGRKRIRRSDPDFLAYSLLDVVCENYILIIERLGEKIDTLEEELLDDPSKEILFQINRYKQEINYLRKCIRPVRDLVNQIPKIEHANIKDETLQYWRELQELAAQASEGIESYRDILGDQLNLYHTTMSMKMNDRMKVLTIFSAIFIPLTFIAGIYGTNFDVLPELHFEYSYFIMLSIMAVVAAGMLFYFWKKKWL